MKKVFRFEDNRVYWDRRWTEAGEDADRFLDLSIYPIKYAQMVMTDRRARTVELGCGLGRLVKHYHNAGFNICGIERSRAAVERIRSTAPELDVRAGDVTQLPYHDHAFDVVLAFGLYHNLEHGLEQALKETARCLRPGGRFCISMRPDNLEMHLNEWYWNRRQRHLSDQPRQFHKWLVGEREFAALLARVGLRTASVHCARNVSLLYRVPFLRERHNGQTETVRRARGYRLNRVGGALDRCLTAVLARQFCNVLVFIGTNEAA